MGNYSYQELADWVNKYFNNTPKAKVTVRTLKFWVAKGLLSEPQGGSRWRFFNEDDLEEAISIRKLQIAYGQGIEDIKELESKARCSPYINHFDHFRNLPKLVEAIEFIEKSGIDPVAEIEAFKEDKRFLVWDEAYNPPYRLLELEQMPDVYFMEGGNFYRRLDFIPDLLDKPMYFKIADIEKYFEDLFQRDYYAQGANYKPGDIENKAKSIAEGIRALIDNGIMTAPRYEYKGGYYLSENDLWAGRHWLTLIKNYDLSYDNLKLIRKRIESDIETFFYTPEEGLFTEELIFYEFQKQVTLFNLCIEFFCDNLIELEESLSGHTKEYSIGLIRDYINGFSFLCRSLYPDYPNRRDICIKAIPFDRLSPKQIEMGLSQGRFTQREVEELLRKKEAEVEALKSIIKSSLKGEDHGSKD